jgi:hypothetical protein
MEKYMKPCQLTFMVIVLLMSMASFTAKAHGGGHFGYGGHFRGHGGYGFEFYSGFPGPFYFPPSYPYYAYPPPVTVIPAEPPVYIEQNHGQNNQRPVPSYWYYCRNPGGYYPYVRECPAGWQPVAPLPQTR